MMTKNKYCMHCIHYHHDKDYGSRYGYCDIGTKKGDKIHMRPTNTMACSKYVSEEKK